jgi:hypothetical protein
MIKLSISIMAHPSRSDFFPGIKEKLGDVPFAIDQNNNLLENCKAAWRLYNPSADFHVVIQDDGIICNNFKERAEKFITEREAERALNNWAATCYNFYCRAFYPLDKMAEFEKQGYLYEGYNRGGVAICLPTNQIESMLKYYDTLPSLHDDVRISQWLATSKFRMCFAIPSLVDHDDHNPSLAGSKPVIFRKAYSFIDDKNNN